MYYHDLHTVSVQRFEMRNHLAEVYGGICFRSSWSLPLSFKFSKSATMEGRSSVRDLEDLLTSLLQLCENRPVVLLLKTVVGKWWAKLEEIHYHCNRLWKHHRWRLVELSGDLLFSAVHLESALHHLSFEWALSWISESVASVGDVEKFINAQGEFVKVAKRSEMQVLENGYLADQVLHTGALQTPHGKWPWSFCRNCIVFIKTNSQTPKLTIL